MDFGGHGTAFKFAALFVGTEQTEVHGTDFFAGVPDSHQLAAVGQESCIAPPVAFG